MKFSNRLNELGQVKKLDKNELFIIGEHAHKHNIMIFLNSDKLKDEIDNSLKLLKTEVGIVTSYYSYSEGMRHCYSDEVISALKSKGIAC